MEPTLPIRDASLAKWYIKRGALRLQGDGSVKAGLAMSLPSRFS